MGQARLVTTRALDVFRDTRKEIVDATNAGDIAPFRAARIYGQLVRLEDEMTFADNRAHVASLALRDVKDVRNIEERCARAWMNPVVFDLGPDAA